MMNVSDTSTESGQGEAGAIRLIRTACKAFKRHGNEQVGWMVEFA